MPSKKRTVSTVRVLSSAPVASSSTAPEPEPEPTLTPSPVAVSNDPAYNLFQQVQQAGLLPANLSYEDFVAQITANSIIDTGDFSDHAPSLSFIFLNVIKSLGVTLSGAPVGAPASTKSRKSHASSKKKSKRGPTGYNLFRADPDVKKQIALLKEDLKKTHPKEKGIRLYNMALKQLWDQADQEAWNTKATQLRE